MASEGFKKEQELIRLLFLAGGAYNRKQLTEKLGMREDNFDVSLRALKEVFNSQDEILISKRSNFVYSKIKYDYFLAFQNFLVKLYSVKSLKTTEVLRLSIILKLLAQQAHSENDLLNAMYSTFEELCDAKSMAAYLQYLVKIGVVSKTVERPHRYSIREDIYDALEPKELLDLNLYIDYCANTAALSTLGYMLRERLSKQLYHEHGIISRQIFSYKYNYFGRILDEYLCQHILAAIRNHQEIVITYYSRKEQQRYNARNTNRKYLKKHQPPLTTRKVIPLRLIYDDQYGRWYLIALEAGKSYFSRFRVENINTVDEGELVDCNAFVDLCNKVDEELTHSWIVQDGQQPCTVKIRFYFDRETSNDNFIRARVEREGRWGKIIGESKNGEWFEFSIVVNGDMEIRPWIRSFGASAEVLEPAELRSEFAKQWREMGELYAAEPI